MRTTCGFSTAVSTEKHQFDIFYHFAWHCWPSTIVPEEHNIDPEAQWFCFPFSTSPLRPSAESIAKRHWKHCGDRPHRWVLWMQTKFGSRFSPKRIRHAIQRHKIQMCPATDQRSPRLREFPEEFGQKIDTLNVSCDVLFVDGQFTPYRSPTYHITYTWIIRKWWNVPMFSQKSTSKSFKLHVKCTKFLPKFPFTSFNCFLGHSSLVSSPLSAQGGWTQYGATWVAFRFNQSALERQMCWWIRTEIVQNDF